ncbi:glutaredoxin [Microbulbifer sp. SSSA002]
MNALLAVIAVLSIFSFTVLKYADKTSPKLLTIVFISTLIFGWIFSDWYKIIPGKKSKYKPYLATTVISFPAALMSGIIYMGITYIIRSNTNLNLIPISEAAFISIMGGLIAAVFALPISLLLGAVLGWYLVNSQKP